MKCSFCGCYFKCKDTVKPPSLIASEGDEKIWKVVKNILHSTSVIIQEVENENIFRKESDNSDRINDENSKKRVGMAFDVSEIKNMLNDNIRNFICIDDINKEGFDDNQFAEQMIDNNSNKLKSNTNSNSYTYTVKSVLEDIFRSTIPSSITDNIKQLSKSLYDRTASFQILQSSSTPSPSPPASSPPPFSLTPNSSYSSLNSNNIGSNNNYMNVNRRQKRQSIALQPISIQMQSQSPFPPPPTSVSLASSTSTSAASVNDGSHLISKSLSEVIISPTMNNDLSSSTSSITNDNNKRDSKSIPSFNVKEIPSPLHQNRSLSTNVKPGTPTHFRKPSLISTIPSYLAVPDIDFVPVTLTLDEKKRRLKKKLLVKYKYNKIPHEFDSSILSVKKINNNNEGYHEEIDEEKEGGGREEESIYLNGNTLFKYTFTKKRIMEDQVTTPTSASPSFMMETTAFSFKDINILNFHSINNNNNNEYEISCEVIQILSSQILANILSDICVYIFSIVIFISLFL